MKTRSRIGAIGAALALAGAAAGFAMSPAGAAQSVNADVTGALTLNLPAPAAPATLDVSTGSTFTGDYDADAGTLTGSVNLGGSTFTTNVTGVGDVDVAISFENGGPITGGVVDATAGTISFSDVETVHLDSAVGLIPDLSPCSIGPVTLDYTGTYDAATGDVSVTSNTVDVPALEGTCGGVASMIAPMLQGATVSAAMQFNLADTEVTPPPTTVPPAAPETVIGDNVVSNGCDVTVPVTFGEAGDYTVQVTTTNDRVLGSTKVTTKATGEENVVVTVKADHGTAKGDPLDVRVLDANGGVVTTMEGTVDDPNACAPTIVKKATPAAPVAAQPTFTG